MFISPFLKFTKDQAFVINKALNKHYPLDELNIGVIHAINGQVYHLLPTEQLRILTPVILNLYKKCEPYSYLGNTKFFYRSYNFIKPSEKTPILFALTIRIAAYVISIFGFIADLFIFIICMPINTSAGVFNYIRNNFVLKNDLEKLTELYEEIKQDQINENINRTEAFENKLKAPNMEESSRSSTVTQLDSSTQSLTVGDSKSSQHSKKDQKEELQDSYVQVPPTPNPKDDLSQSGVIVENEEGTSPPTILDLYKNTDKSIKKRFNKLISDIVYTINRLNIIDFKEPNIQKALLPIIKETNIYFHDFQILLAIKLKIQWQNTDNEILFDTWRMQIINAHEIMKNIDKNIKGEKFSKYIYENISFIMQEQISTNIVNYIFIYLKNQLEKVNSKFKFVFKFIREKFESDKKNIYFALDIYDDDEYESSIKIQLTFNINYDSTISVTSKAEFPYYLRKTDILLVYPEQRI